MFRLDDKIVVLIGGGGYLGLEFTKALLDFGAIVYSCDIKENEYINDQKKQHGERYHFHIVDCTDKDDIIKFKDIILEKEKKVDVLINSVTAKGDDFYLPFEDVSLEGWEIGIKGNITIPFLTSQVFIPVMAEQKFGSVINISSIYGIVGNDQRIYEGSNLHECYLEKQPDLKQVYAHPVYPAAKGGLIVFTKYLAAYYGKDNVRANCISPGGVYHEQENEVFVKKYSDKTPLGRKAKPDEINGALIFLASDASSYVTGHNLVVDGGWTAW